MNDSAQPPRPHWLGIRGAPQAAPPVEAGASLELPATPARLLLRDHLHHGAAARREAAAFALALTQPEAARAIAAFFTSRGRKGGRMNDAG